MNLFNLFQHHQSSQEILDLLKDQNSAIDTLRAIIAYPSFEVKLRSTRSGVSLFSIPVSAVRDYNLQKGEEFVCILIKKPSEVDSK